MNRPELGLAKTAIAVGVSLFSFAASAYSGPYVGAQFGINKAAVSFWRESGVPLDRMQRVEDLTEGAVGEHVIEAACIDIVRDLQISQVAKLVTLGQIVDGNDVGVLHQQHVILLVAACGWSGRGAAHHRGGHFQRNGEGRECRGLVGEWDGGHFRDR